MFLSMNPLHDFMMNHWFQTETIWSGCLTFSDTPIFCLLWIQIMQAYKNNIILNLYKSLCSFFLDILQVDPIATYFS